MRAVVSLAASANAMLAFISSTVLAMVNEVGPAARLLPARTCALLWLISLHPAASAQSLGAGTLKGTVRDSTGAFVPSVNVELLSNPVSGFSARTQTGTDGAFLINKIPPNNYRLLVSLSGFQDAHQECHHTDGDPDGSEYSA